MQSRIKAIRKYLDLTQTQFGERIGIKQNTIAAYESGIRVPSEAAIVSICREFHVNRHWLETGEGEMLNPESDRANDQYPPIIRAVLKTYDRLNPTEQSAFCKFLNEFVAECTGENLPPIKGESPARQPSPAEQARARGGIPLDDFNNSSQSKSS